MSLLEEAMQKCVMLNESSSDDGYGGTNDSYTEGIEFDAAIVLKSSVEKTTAQALNVTSEYVVTTNKDVMLSFHQCFKRKKDSKVFRVTSDGDDVFTPKSAHLNMRQVTAEEWKVDR